MWLTRPRWERSEVLTLLGKQLDTYRLFGLAPQIDSELSGILDELRLIAS
jgi:hypothetical protein